MRLTTPTRWVGVALLLLVASLSPALRGEFVYDDYPYLVENPDLTGDLSRVGRLFTSSFPSHAPERGLYRPVTALSFRLDRLAGPAQPLRSHAVNLALAMALVLLVYRTLSRFLGMEAVLAATLLFAVHPVHVEAFAWVTGRSELLAALGLLGAFTLAHDVAGGRGGALRATLAGGLLLAAFLAKESALVALLLLVLAIVFDPKLRSRAKTALAALTLAAIVGFAARLSVLGGLGPSAGERVGAERLIERGPLIVAAAGEHLRLLLWPHPLSVERMTIPPQTWSDPRVLVGGLFVIAFLAVAAWRSVRSGPSRFFALWPFVALLPVAHIVPIGESVAERFLLVPSIGVCALAGMAFARGRARWPAVSSGIAGLVIVAGLVMSTVRANEWRTEEAVWRSALRHEPRSALARTALGDSYARREWPDKAIEHYELALAIDPGRTVTRLALAQAWDALDRPELALEASSRAVNIDPDHPVALNNLGARLARTGRVEEAAKMFRRAVQLAPGYAPALRNAALASLQSGDREEARRLLDRAREADPEAPGLDQLEARLSESSR